MMGRMRVARNTLLVIRCEGERLVASPLRVMTIETLLLLQSDDNFDGRKVL